MASRLIDYERICSGKNEGIHRNVPIYAIIPLIFKNILNIHDRFTSLSKVYTLMLEIRGYAA